MIINDLDVLGTGRSPAETQAHLIVDPNAVPSRPIPFESLQAVSGRDAGVIQPARDLQLPEFAAGWRRNIGEPPQR
jgi:hypothetical protein